MAFPVNITEIISSGLITQYTDTFLYTLNDLKNACQGLDELRLKQLLGMSPEIIINGIIEVYVNASEIFRPCADPSIYDSECELSVMLINDDAGLGPCPWYCGENTEEKLSKLVTVKEEQFDWMCERWEISFGNEELYSNRPWTGLGYTYNWASDTHFGVNEFAVLAFTEVEVVEKFTVEEYCQNFENTES
ncbi:hypothetical protein SteCoe_35948 [Stentor coeruleus]|uniref:Uncharacterized protein n=1 Tax=Stentor coeruleus TaxID=5963 RepID=A0A1R2AR55_9CILI|nr:hypothetical protein SteCoe_35948 [Stentor coeruleus]